MAAERTVIKNRMALLEALYPLQEICRYKKSLDTDHIDRLNSKQTVFLLTVLSVVVTARQFTGEPVACWAPAEFSPEWAEYTNKICWVSNTYYVPIDERIPSVHENKSERIAYYQWVPLIIMCQAIMFAAPNILWAKLNTRSGIQIGDLVGKLATAERYNAEGRSKTISHVVKCIDRSLASQKEYRRGWCVQCRHELTATCCWCICGKRYGNYLVSLYLLIKAIYIANSLGQLFILNEFLGDRYHAYGYDVIREIVNGHTWKTSRRFPSVALCDFKIRTLGNRIHQYTVQCVMSVNLFHEKVFLFIWFWLVFTSMITTLSFIAWLWTLFLHNRHEYIRKYLKKAQRNFPKKEKIPEGYIPSRRFTNGYLTHDGAFVLRVIAINTNGLVMSELITKMWEKYCERLRKKKEEDEKREKEELNGIANV